MPVLPVRPVDGGQNGIGLHTPDAGEVVLEDSLLDGDLRSRIQMLEAAAATPVIVATAGCHPHAAGVHDAHRIGQIETRLATPGLDLHTLSGQGGVDEGYLPGDTRNAAPFQIEGFDTHQAHAAQSAARGSAPCPGRPVHAARNCCQWAAVERARVLCTSSVSCS